MKNSIFCIIFIISILFSCTKKTVDETSGPIEEKSGPVVAIDSVCLGKKEFKENCFLQEEVCYFKISGEGDWKEMNKLIQETALDFIDSSRVQTECVNEKEAPAYLGWAHTYYEILESHEGVVSVVMYLSNGFGGGNNWTPSATVFNIDPVNIELITNEQLLSNLNVNREGLNKTIYAYFNSMFPGEVEESIGKNFLDNKVDINNLEYGLRNDSLMLVIPAYPTAHFSYDVYLIPVKKL